MRLEVFIAELLYRHDCVVLPGFGGLVANYKPATLNPHSHIVAPPSKQVGFNRNLKTNDGLLTSHIAGMLQIEYKKAAEMLQSELEGYKSVLAGEGRISLKNIGIFYHDKSGMLQFMPDDQENFLLSSYGLKSIQLKPVMQKIEPEAIVIEHPKSASRSAWKIAAAIAIPLMIGASVLVNNQLKHSDNFSFSNLNPFADRRIVADLLPPNSAAPEISEPRPADFTAWPESTSKGIVTYNFEEDRQDKSGIRVKVETPEVKVADVAGSNVSKAISSSGKFAVIGGAFMVKENADKFLAMLKEQGFDARPAGKKDGLYLVAYGVYSTRNEADNALNNIRYNDNKSAWIRRY